MISLREDSNENLQLLQQRQQQQQQQQLGIDPQQPSVQFTKQTFLPESQLSKDFINSEEQSPPYLIIQAPSGKVFVAFSSEFIEQMKNDFEDEEHYRQFQQPHQNEGHAMNEDEIYNYTEQEMYNENIILERRKKLLLFTIILDLCYCIVLLLLQIIWQGHKPSKDESSADKPIADQPFFLPYLVVGIVNDLIGFAGTLRDHIWAITIFVFVEGVSLCFTTFSNSLYSLSPFIFFHLAIVLLTLQVRAALVKKQRLRLGTFGFNVGATGVVDGVSLAFGGAGEIGANNN